MQTLKIADIGLHASKCANGAKPYLGISIKERDEIQYRLIVDIVAAKLHGCLAISELDGYRKREQTYLNFIQKHHQKYIRVHILAVRQCVHLMQRFTEPVTTEPISFVMDRNKEFGKRAYEWYHADINNAELDGPMPGYRARLGPYAEDERMRVLGLQAADLIAYAAFRHFSGLPSWQWDELKNGIGIMDFLFDDSYWETLERDMRAYAERKAAGNESLV
jgi:uncharacterized protein DUF3800